MYCALLYLYKNEANMSRRLLCLSVNKINRRLYICVGVKLMTQRMSHSNAARLH